ncbi:hypothetical protein FD754_014223 [Muntiacus muntjak]|uniref:Ribosomal biogenesis factor n=1 Tax=Muntiacus muntjak TaxID=9888 RepID=A0A5N3VMV0_MUNMU|nr:hypothetical protein FD754_014223 [Muntiacus muntjak]
MAKNKLRGQKSRNIFQIASQKSFKVKNKAKPATTNLNKINTVIPQQCHESKPANIDETNYKISGSVVIH